MGKKLVPIDTPAATNTARELAEARTLGEVKAIRDKLEALTGYARSIGAGRIELNQIAEAKIWAERKAGAMLAGLERYPAHVTPGPGRGKKNLPHDGVGFSPYQLALREVGLDSRPGRKMADRWQVERVPPDEWVRGYLIDQNQKAADVTSADVYREGRKLLNAEVRAVIAGQPVDVPAGTYACLIIDPPWEMQKIQREERPKQVGFDYPTMSEAQLLTDPVAGRPIAEYAAENCHLYLWTTHKHLPAALRLAEGWGFTYQCLMTWIKNVGFTPFSWMYSTEHVLFCRKGNLPLLKLGMRLDFRANVREHSRKPDEFYDLVRAASPEPRAELFAREARDGFQPVGNEVEKFDVQALR